MNEVVRNDELPKSKKRAKEEQRIPRNVNIVFGAIALLVTVGALAVWLSLPRLNTWFVGFHQKSVTRSLATWAPEAALEAQRRKSIALVVASLERYTGLDYGTNVERWTEWVEKRKSSEPDGAANRSQPIRAETNRTSAAAASPR